MAEPTPKAPEVKAFIDALFGRSAAIETDHCSNCHKEAIEFRDEKSYQEYRISGLCQVCQDDVFGGSGD